MSKKDLKRHAISALITFVATFLLVVSFELKNPEFIFSTYSLKALVLSGLIAGVRAVAKIVYESVREYVK
jgi:hypothetical protein